MPHYRHPRPAVAADILLFAPAEHPSQILLIRRKNEPFADQWAFPGGFVDEDEDPQHAAARELLEETGVDGIVLEPFRFYGAPDRDPRGHCVSCVFAGKVAAEEVRPIANDDAAEVAWFSLAKLPELAFDHAQILAEYLTTHS